MLRTLLCGVLLFAPTVSAQEEEAVDLEGHAVMAGGAVRSGTFRIETGRDDELVVRHIRASSRKRLRDLALLVDEQARVRVPSELSIALLEPMRALVAELAEEQASQPAAEYWRLASALPEPGSELAAGLLRELMLSDPDHAEGVRAVNALAPAQSFEIWSEVARTHPTHPALRAMLDERLPAPLEAASAPDGLRFLARTAPYELRVWATPEEVPSSNPLERNKLGRAQVSPVWGRRDLIGLRTQRLYIITPLRDVALLGECIARGELVLNALESLFAERTSVRSARYPLLVYLYESREEYLEKGTQVRNRVVEDPGHAASAGNFNEREEVSRFYLPGEDGARDQLLRALTHELAHHWIFSNCPAFTTAQARAASQSRGDQRPGHWIVEGFAHFVEEFNWNEQSGSWGTLNVRSDALDITANVNGHMRLNWTDVLEGTKVDFENTSTLDERTVGSSLQSGASRVLSSRALYYAQAAAVCNYLYHAEEGRQRKQLLDYLVAYYAGDRDALDMQRAFGSGVGALGDQAILFARAAVEAD